MKNMRRVLRESWRGEEGRKVIDLKVMGKPTGLRREQQPVSTDTETPADFNNNGMNS